MSIWKQYTSTILLTLSLLFSIQTVSSATTKSDKHARQLTRSEIKEASQRLSQMGYGTGGNALILFQKWEGRKLSGRLNRAEFDAIMSAEAPQPKDSGYKHVEVNLDRQVLLLIDDDGAVRRILPVSTGSKKRYNEKGVRGLAYTPIGRFRIYTKISGWRKSPLGLLYYPSYFSDGLAIHGNPSVPNQPRSHGCIRIPMSAAVAVYKQLRVGTIVLIYDSESFVSAKEWAEADRQKQAVSIQ